MPETEWYAVVEKLTPYVFRILTPQGSGTGFLVSNSKSSDLCAVATAGHVISHAHYWEEPVRIEHQGTGKTLLLRKDQRAIITHSSVDTAAIIFERGDMAFPADSLPLALRGRHFKPGVEIGWLGYPAIPQASLCFFSGHISAWLAEEQAYLVDGVAINGVSGGPAFIAEGVFMGVVTEYRPNRATGESLPGLALVRSVEPFHGLAGSFPSLDEAKTKETPPTGSPPIREKEG